MRVFKNRIPYGLFLLVAAIISIGQTSCRKYETATVKINNVTYGLDTLTLYSSAAEKTRLKTPTQYISILYTNLYQSSIPSNTLNDLAVLSTSIGDQQMYREMEVKSLISAPGVVMPTNAAMRADIDKFILNTYILFYLRKPAQIEIFHLKSAIQSNTSLSPADIYTAFALSDEYLYY